MQFANIALISSPNIYIYGAFIFLFVYAFTELMDSNKNAVIWETLKVVSGICLIYYLGDWFSSDKFSVAIKYVLIGYFILSLLVTFWLTFKKNVATVMPQHAMK